MNFPEEVPEAWRGYHEHAPVTREALVRHRDRLCRMEPHTHALEYRGADLATWCAVTGEYWVWVNNRVLDMTSHVAREVRTYPTSMPRSLREYAERAVPPRVWVPGAFTTNVHDAMCLATRMLERDGEEYTTLCLQGTLAVKDDPKSPWLCHIVRGTRATIHHAHSPALAVLIASLDMLILVHEAAPAAGE